MASSVLGRHHSSAAANSLYSVSFHSVAEFEKLDHEDMALHLEDLLKENDLLREETLIFVSRSQSQGISDDATELQANQQGRKQKAGAKNAQAGVPTLRLTVDQKLEVISQEMDELRGSMDKENDEHDQSLEKLRATMEATDARIAEIKKDSYEFKRDIVQGEQTRSGRVQAERVVRYFVEQAKSKDAFIDKLKLKNTALKNHVVKLAGQVQSREDMGEVLHFIDFDQLKIENQQYIEKIEERNDELLKLKVTTGNAVLTLNDLTEKLNKLSAESQWLRKEIKTREDNLAKTKVEIEKVLHEKDVAASKHSTLRRQHEDVRVPEIMEYVNQKAEVYELQKAVKNWERKVEIAEANMRLLVNRSRASAGGSSMTTPTMR